MNLSRGDRPIRKLLLNGREVTTLVRGGRVVYRTGSAVPLPQLEYRVFDDGDNKWWEAWFYSGEELSGSAADGWTDVRGYAVLRLERSEDLQSWDHNFTDLADNGTEVEAGIWKYGGRTIYPVDSVTKTGQLSLVRSRPDPRSNPLTAIVISDVDLALPNFPYDLPTDAATLQADLVAEGFTGATVEALSGGAYWALVTNYAGQLPVSPVSQLVIDNATQSLPNYPYTIPGDEALLISDLEDLGWTDVSIVYQGGYRIDIPDVESTGYNPSHRVDWTPYLVENMLGELVNYVSSISFDSEAVNEDGVRTAVASQFTRLRLTRGTRVLP